MVGRPSLVAGRWSMLVDGRRSMLVVRVSCDVVAVRERTRWRDLRAALQPSPPFQPRPLGGGGEPNTTGDCIHRAHCNAASYSHLGRASTRLPPRVAVLVTVPSPLCNRQMQWCDIAWHGMQWCDIAGRSSTGAREDELEVGGAAMPIESRPAGRR